jgi:hypothetical protein
VIPKQEQLTARQAGDLAGFSAASVTRWIERGVRLRSGATLKLRAERYPAGWRTCEAWVRDFVTALTTDRTGTTPIKSEVAEALARRADSVLAATGW